MAGTGNKRNARRQRSKGALTPAREPASPALTQRTWIASNAVALAALVPVVLATARLIAFSGGDLALLSTLVQTLDVPAVLIGSIAPALAWVLGFALFVVIANRHITPAATRWFGQANPLARLVVLLWFMLAVFATPWPAVSMLIVLPLAGWLYRWVTGLWDRRSGYVPADVVAVVTSMVLTFLVTPVAWMPAEIVTYADERTESVYVAEDSNGWVTTISVETHRVEKVPSSELVSRQVCNPAPSRSLLALTSGLDPQPACNTVARGATTPPTPAPSPSPYRSPEIGASQPASLTATLSPETESGGVG